MPRRTARVVALLGWATGLSVVLLGPGRLPPVSAQPKLPPIPPAPQAPTLTTPAHLGAKAGETVELTLTGTNLNDPTTVVLTCPARVTIPPEDKNGTDPAKLRVRVELPPDCPLGVHALRVATRQGVSNLRPFVVDQLPPTPETEANRSKETAQSLSVPVVIAGRTDAEASDFFKVSVSPGQTLTFEVLARRLGSPLDPLLVLYDAKTKRPLPGLTADDTPGLQGDCRLTHTFKDGGEILVEVRDSTYRGGGDFHYRLRIGEFPGVTTAFPLAVQRGQSAAVGFSGPNASALPPVTVTAPADPDIPALAITPRKGELGGWPVPVRISDWPEAVEHEPNDDPGQANRLPVPGGVSARFEKAGDVDHFVVSCQKGAKYTATAATFEVNSPCEVLIRVLDGKGGEVARSQPNQPQARAEFTAVADGDYVIACEQLNFLGGPNEVYHLTVRPATPDFAVALSFDRAEAAAGGGTAVAATVTRLNGYAGPVELEVVGEPVAGGSITVPPAQTVTFVPLLIRPDARPGVYRFRVRGRAVIDGQQVVRYATLTEPVRASLAGLPNPPLELVHHGFLVVVEKPPFALTLKADPPTVAKGQATKAVAEVRREPAADGDIGLAPLFVPPNITPAATKGIPKGSNRVEVGLTVAPAAAAGPNPVVFRATAKVAGKDYAVIPPPVVLDVTEPKKDEPKEPKK